MLKPEFAGLKLPIRMSSAFSSSAGIPTKIQVIPCGEWDHPQYGLIKITPDDIRQFAANFNKGLRKGVRITEGHEIMDEKPAVGWMTQVYDEGSKGLWADVEWTSDGKQMLSEKKYKYFSPEFYRDYEDPETRQEYSNVLVGGALTNSPYFKELQSIVLSDRNIINKQINTMSMNMKDLVKKEVSQLNADEKGFIKANKKMLDAEGLAKFKECFDEPAQPTAEEKAAAEAKAQAEAKAAEDKAAADKAAADKAVADAEAAKVAEAKAAEEKVVGDANEAKGLNRDGSEKKVEGSEKKFEQISASELAALRAAADQGKQAFAELKAAKMGADVSKLIFNDKTKEGSFLPKSKAGLQAFMESLNEKQYASFIALVGELPKASSMFSEIGKTDADGKSGDASETVEVKVAEKMKANPKMKYSEALKEVYSENKSLHDQYVAEKGGKIING